MTATILLVEDEFLIRLLLSESLTEAGFAVIEAASGREALEKLALAGRIDLLFTDVHMLGGLSGLQVAHQARATRPNLPILFATGRPDALSAEATPGPPEAILVKPFSPTQALGMIRRLLGSMPPSSRRLSPG